MRCLCLNLLLFLFLTFQLDAKFIWKSSDGRKVDAEGLFWNRDGVCLKLVKGQRRVFIKFDKLDKYDANWAIENLVFGANDAIRLRAKSVSTSVNTLTRETGSYAATVNLYSYNGYSASGSVSFSPILQKYRTSGRTVEAEISSIVGDGIVAVEFYGVRGSGKYKSIYHKEKGVVEFKKTGSVVTFGCPATENFGGWVVIARSVATGAIIETVASLYPLKTFVLSKIPPVANIKGNLGSIIAEVKNNHDIKPKPELLVEAPNQDVDIKKPNAVLLNKAYVTKIEEDKDEILKLANGAIVEVDSILLGFVGFNKDAILFKDTLTWKLWIKGKKAFSCDVIKEPDQIATSFEKISVSEIRGNGKIIKTLSGSIFEVNPINEIDVSVWVPPFNGLIINGNQIINLDQNGPLVDITRL